jgi:protein TonB
VRVTVTANGRAANCQVTASSGSPDLDQAACQGMERYAQFNPALDPAGNPTDGSYSTRITYRIN